MPQVRAIMLMALGMSFRSSLQGRDHGGSVGWASGGTPELEASPQAQEPQRETEDFTLTWGAGDRSQVIVQCLQRENPGLYMVLRNSSCCEAHRSPQATESQN